MMSQNGPPQKETVDFETLELPSETESVNNSHLTVIESLLLPLADAFRGVAGAPPT